MELFRKATDFWGREVMEGVSWDFLPIFFWSGMAVIVTHALFIFFVTPKKKLAMTELNDNQTSERITRHSLSARVFHWTMAVSVLTLLITAFFPILGMELVWLEIHWIAGLVLTFTVFFHVIRALVWQKLRSIMFGFREMDETFKALSWMLKLSNEQPPKPGKYSPAQKLVHTVVAVLVLLVILTGLQMLVKIDTPFVTRDLYWLTPQAWGFIYVLHGFAALFLILIVTVHVYFAVRPEKLHYTRSMLRGWITRSELEAGHDEQRWKGDVEL